MAVPGTDPGIVLTRDGRNKTLFLVFPFFYGFFLAVLMIFFFLFLAFLTREQVFSRGYRRSARENSLPPLRHPRPCPIMGAAPPIKLRSGRRVLNHPELAFPILSPLNHEKLQDSTVLENLKANVGGMRFWRCPRLAGASASLLNQPERLRAAGEHEAPEGVGAEYARDLLHGEEGDQRDEEDRCVGQEAGPRPAAEVGDGGR